MNKKASISIIVLVIGVVAVCALALISFYVANLKTNNFFKGIYLMEEANSQAEQNLFTNGFSNPIHLEEKKQVLSPGFSGWKPHLIKEKVIFSVDYSP